MGRTSKAFLDPAEADQGESVIVVATAGWSVPRACAERFPGEGTHLRRYARVLLGAEIDTSFYRDHARATYARWAAQVPRGFRFAVKLPRTITHERKLRRARLPLLEFLDQVSGLGPRLGPLLVQLPPSLEFESQIARRFFALLRQHHAQAVVCEPRHATWFGARADALLAQFHIARVAADPPVVAAAAQPGGWPGLAYFRLHGSPHMYWSVYETARLAQWTQSLRTLRRGTLAWCVFDNTAGAGAAANALQMLELLKTPKSRRPAGSSVGRP